MTIVPLADALPPAMGTVGPWWSAPVAALLAGLLGGVHCVGMCGGIAGALGAAARGSPVLRLAAFNAGRIGSYALAGTIAGALGGVATLLLPLHGFRVGLFIAAQAMLILVGLYIAGWSGWFPRLEAAGATLWQGMAPLRRRLLPIDTHAKAILAGGLWGWVPCGMIYGMLPFAIATGSPVSGAGILAAFGVGTLPGVLVAGVAGARFGEWRKRAAVRRIAGTAVIGLAVFGLAHLPPAADLLAYAWLCVR